MNLLNELCKEVSFVIWSFFIARTFDTFKGIFTLQEREELDRIVKENYKDKSDKNFKNLYKPYKDEKSVTANIEIIKNYYRVGRERYPLVDASYDGMKNPALEALMDFRGDTDKNAGPYQ